MSGSSYTNIYGNTCTDTRSAGSKTQLYGILEYSGSDYNYIHDNDVNGNSNGPGQNIYNIYGVHDKIYNNSGFNPQGKISNPFSNPGTITNGSGTLSGGPTLNLLGNGSAQTITTTSSGTFTIVLPYNMTATATYRVVHKQSLTVVRSLQLAVLETLLYKSCLMHHIQ
jgi:hypothetical protein